MQVSLEQWQAMLAVVDEGGYARAAEALGKSQSAISYAISKLEESLQVRVFRLQGRRAVLTTAGELLYHRARRLLDSAAAMEATAKELAGHWQASLSLAVDAVFPDDMLFQALARFGEEFPLTRINLLETVLSGSSEALIRRDASLAISGSIPAGFIGDPILQQTFIAVAAPQHPLHQLQGEITLADQKTHRQLAVRDSGSQQLDAGWLGADQRWTVSHLSTSIRAAEAGLGFAWYPQRQISAQLADGRLKPLPLREGGQRQTTLYLVYADSDFVSPACERLGQFLREAAQQKTETGLTN